MGDRAWAKLVIGGPVSRETLAELLLDEGYDLDDAEEGYEGREGLYLERRGGGHVLVLEDCDQLGAMREGLEAALVEAGIAFDRFSNGYAGSWSDSIAAWRPGMPQVYETVADANQQHAYGRLDEIRAALAQAGSLDDFRAWFNTTHPDVPSLEPITWLPGEADAETLNA
ncbi:MAG: hypothetical protein ACREKH_00075 [Candidatus Rokuibacteriota bacterium]